MGVDSCRGCNKRGPGVEDAGGEKGRKEIIIWMVIVDRLLRKVVTLLNDC